VTPVGDRTLRPLVGGLFTTLFRVLMDRARTLPGGALEREVRLLLDEFGTMGAVPDAPDRFNVLRQVRVSRVLSFQMRSQLIDDYEETGAEALVESCNALAWLGGTRGKDAQWASDTVGKRTVLAYSEGDSAAPGGLFGRRPERDSRSASEAGVPLLFPEDLHASSRRRIVVSVREARPMDLRTRPFYTVRALKRLSKLPAPPPCLEAPATPAALAPAPVPVPVQAAASPAHATPPASVAQPPPAPAPSAPVRVVATAPAPAKTTAPVSPPLGATPTVAAATATAAPTEAHAPASGPPRVPTAPVKHGRAYDWTGLP